MQIRQRVENCVGHIVWILFGDLESADTKAPNTFSTSILDTFGAPFWITLGTLNRQILGRRTHFPPSILVNLRKEVLDILRFGVISGKKHWISSDFENLRGLRI